MTNEITDKILVIMLKGNYKCWISQKQAEVIKQAIKSNASFVEVDDLFFKAESIMFILPADEIEEQDHIKKGDWQCQYCGSWIPKNMECGCQQGRFKDLTNHF